MYENQAIQGLSGAQLAQFEPPKTERETEVRGELRQLVDVVDSLQSEALNLFERLGPVQRMGAPTANGKEAAHPSPALCPIADQIRTIRERIGIIVMQIESNRTQLEI